MPFRLLAICLAFSSFCPAVQSQENSRTASPKLRLVTYPVGDIRNCRDETGQQDSEKKQLLADCRAVPEKLIDLIRKTVQPLSWDGFGGVGSLQYFPIGGAIIINQTPAVHEEIHALLSAIRRLERSQQICSRTYSVADLIVPITERNADGKTNEPIKTIENELMQLIRGTVAPHTWRENGGDGVVQFFPLGMAMVIHQRQEVHEEISALLAALRRLQDLEVAVEIKVLHASGKVLKGLCKAPEGNVPFLTDAQVRDLLKEPGLDVVQAPRMTMANGQSVNLRMGDVTSYLQDVTVTSEDDKIVVKPKNEVVHTGWHWQILPVVSADRRYVRLGLDLTFRSVESPVPTIPVTIPVVQRQENGADHKVPLTTLLQRPKVITRRVEQTVSILDGQTALLYGGLVSAPSEDEVHEIVLVTPRILVLEEEERVFEGLLPPIPKPNEK